MITDNEGDSSLRTEQMNGSKHHRGPERKRGNERGKEGKICHQPVAIQNVI